MEVLRTSGMCSGVVMLTDSDSDEDEREALRSGVDDVPRRRPCGADGIAAAVVDAPPRTRATRSPRSRAPPGRGGAGGRRDSGRARPRHALTAGWRIETGFIPASQVGGDCFDLLARDGNEAAGLARRRLGKGVGAALLAGMAQTAVRAASLRGDDPAAALRATNEVLFEPLGRAGRFLTAFLALLDLETGDLRYADAGHGHCVLLTAENVERPVPGGGQPLGFLPEADYPLGMVRLERGDRLAVFSDGLVEGDGQPADYRAALVDAIHRGVPPSTLVAEAPDADDRTMVLLERVQ